MIDCNFFFKCLKKNNTSFFTGVPDSLMKNLISCIDFNTNSNEHLIAANEGNAIGLAIGNFLSTGKLPIVYLQNSGLGNIINPVLSLADKDVYGIPMIILLGWRGRPGVKDEPQHFKQGLVTEDILNSIQLPYSKINQNLSDIDLEIIIDEAYKTSKEKLTPYVLLIEEGTFNKFENKNLISSYYDLSREEALQICVNSLNEKDIIVSTTGTLSRELYELRKKLGQSHKSDFLTVGGMGHANQIAIGIAINKPKRNIYCLDGDGAILMHMGSMALNGNIKPLNFNHILFNNQCHDSVGGQKTAAPELNFKNLAEQLDYQYTSQCVTKNQIIKSLDIIKNNNKTSFLEIKVNNGFKKNLPRPNETPKFNKDLFVKFINDE